MRISRRGAKMSRTYAALIPVPYLSLEIAIQEIYKFNAHSTERLLIRALWNDKIPYARITPTVI